MKRKNPIYYLIYSIITISFIFLWSYINQKVTMEYKTNFNMNMFWLIGLSFIKNISFGCIIGLGHLIKEIKKSGVWKFNISKVIFIGIPSLYFSLAMLIYYSPMQEINLISKSLEILVTNQNNSISLFQILLGFTVVTCFYKYDKGIYY